MTAVGDIDVSALRNLLESRGIVATHEIGERGRATRGLLVVLVDDYLRPELGAINAEALVSGGPWLLAKPAGTVLWFGPLYRPGRTGCWSCLAQRLRHNRPVESFLLAPSGHGQRPFPVSRACVPTTTALAYELIATRIASWRADEDRSDLDGAVVTLDVVTGETRRHELTRRPQCRDCGDRQARTDHPRPIALRSVHKGFVADGGHRTVSPDVTFARFRHHISPITGPVSIVERMPVDSDWQFNVYTAGQNFGSGQPNLFLLQQGLRVKASGKGMTDAQARTSALCEALERYSSVFHGDEPRRTASFRELGGAAIHPNACMLFSERQFEQRERWNAHRAATHVVPEPLDEDTPLEWSPVWSLTRRECRYLPTGYLYFSYPLHGRAFVWADSNGNAAGNTLEEAILQGFLELVERDAVAIWWYNRLRRRRVDLASFGERYICELDQRYGDLKRDLWLLDITSDLGIPTFAAVSRRVDKPAEDIVFGFGAHLDPRIAALRAFSELNQLLPAVLPVGPDGGDYAMHDPACRHWWQTATVANQPYLAPDLHAGVARATDFPYRRNDDVLEDVRLCQRLVETRGYQMLVLDMTRPDICLPVVKVIVPGMRHFWARFAPGRLYNVPVEQSWLERPLGEDELNPVAMFL